jgi:hypothetical protein
MVSRYILCSVKSDSSGRAVDLRVGHEADQPVFVSLASFSNLSMR